MTITQMRAMMRRFGLFALPVVGLPMLVYLLRRNRGARRCVVILLLFMAAVCTAARLHPNRSPKLGVFPKKTGFVITDLGMPAGYSKVSACSINNKGQVVGYVSTESDENKRKRPFIWQEGAFQFLDTGEMLSGIATGINDRGEIVGYVYTGSSQYKAALWTEGKMRLLESPVGRSSFAFHLNNEQQICGASMTGQGMDAVLWDSGQIQTILRGGSVCTCDWNNDRGEVVGTELVGSFVIEAYLYTNGRITRLPGLGGDGDGARSINNNGEIVGWAEHAGSWHGHATLWVDGTVRDIGTLGGDESGATDINDQQDIVGWSKSRTNAVRPFLWRQGKMVDINVLLPEKSNWILASVSAINNAGQMIGSGTNNGNARAFVLTPIQSR